MILYVRRKGMSTEVLKEILAYIDEHIYEKISLLEMAEMAGYSPFYFSKLFSEIMGIPITGYIRIRKLQYALGSLLEGRKVLDVSLATVYKGNIIKNLIMDCQSYAKYRPNETTGGIFVSWRRKEELPTGA